MNGDSVKLNIFNKDFAPNVKVLFTSLIAGMAVVKYSGMSTTNILGLVVFILLFKWFGESRKVTDKLVRIASTVCGALFAASMFLVKLWTFQFEERKLYKWFLIFVYIIGFYLLFKNLLLLMFKYMSKVNFTSLSGYKHKKMTRKDGAFIFFGSMLVMLAVWTIYFLRRFPGDVTADSADEMIQTWGDAPLSNHHPIAHTMVIKLFMSLGLALFPDNYTNAIATYNVCQMILLSASFAFFITTMCKFRIKKPVIAVVLAFYALVPYNGVYSCTMWKDVWFAGIVITLTTIIWRLIRHYQDEDTKSKLPLFEIIMLFIFGVGMCLFRSNGLYAFIVLAPFLFFFFRKKNLIVALTAVVVLPIAFIVKGPVYNSMGVTPPDPIESLSIPAQHIARVVTDGGELTPEQYELLSKIVDVESIPANYSCHISDSIKNLVRATDNQEYLEEHKGEYFTLWLELGMKYPKEYLLAQIDQTYGYWFPDEQYWVYAGEFSVKGSHSYTTDYRFSDKTRENIEKFMNSYKDVPCWGLLWSIGTFSWCCLFMFGVCFVRRRKAELIIYIPVFAILGTLMIATPVFSEFRYAYSMFATTPVLCIVPFAVMNKKKSEKEDMVLFAEELPDKKSDSEISDVNEKETEILETTDEQPDFIIDVENQQIIEPTSEGNVTFEVTN